MPSHQTFRPRRRTALVPEFLESRSYFDALTFSDPKIFEVGGAPLTTPLLVDLNHDGKLDAVTANGQTTNGTVSVLLGQGDGNFGMKTDLAAGARPFEVVAGDFNGDTKIDLAVTNGDDGTVSVFLGHGDGTFAAQTTFVYGTPAVPGSGSLASLKMADLNGDTELDLVIGNASGKQIVSMLGGGDGTFTVRQSSPTGSSSSPGNIIIGDFDGDTNMDVAYNLGTTPTLRVQFGNGDGTFTNAALFPVANTNGLATGDDLVAGDFNNDGRTDVFMLTTPFDAPLASTMSVFLSNGDRTFQASKDQPGLLFGTRVTAADINSDGKLDVFVTNSSDFVIVDGNGDGTFATSNDFTKTNFNPADAANFADFNGDGKLDLAVGEFNNTVSSGHAIAIFLNGVTDGGGGGGGGGTGTPAIATTLNATLPPAVVGGTIVRGAKVSVTVTNTGTADLKAPVTISLFASTDATLDDADTAVGAPITKTLSIKQGTQKLVKLKLGAIPALADGDYFLLAKTSSAGLADAASASGSAVNVAAPFVDLSGVFATSKKTALKRGRKASVPLAISTGGNIVFAGTANVSLTFVAAPGSGLADIPVTPAPVKLKLKPGVPKNVKLNFVVPAEAVAGAYTLRATIDSANVVTESNEANNDVVGATAFTIS